MIRKKPLNTTKPSMDRLKADGYIAQNVEVYLPWCKRKRDFCNFADILAFKPDERGVLAIQTTTRDNMRARLHKCMANERVTAWLRAGNRLQIWGWQLDQSGRRKTWRLSILHVVAAASDGGKVNSACIDGEGKKNTPPNTL